MTTRKAAKQGIFISYRRSDTVWLAGRLKDSLESSLRGWRVYLDVESLPVGERWRVEINRKLACSSYLLALIGEGWRGGDTNRIIEMDDAVRYEVATALTSGLKVIPILVDKAAMPDRQSLPDDIADITDITATEIRSTMFPADVANLVRIMTGQIANEISTSLASVLKGAAVVSVSGLVLACVCLSAYQEATGIGLGNQVTDGPSILLVGFAIIGGWIGYRRVVLKKWPFGE